MESTALDREALIKDTGGLELAKNGKKILLENTATGMAAVRWAINKGLIQQGFTALEETIKTFLCEMKGKLR